MDAHEFLSPYQAKAVEYLLAVSYLLLFIPFWRFVNGSARLAEAPALAKARPRRATSWFEVPDGIDLHPGHAWLRASSGTAVTVGFDDFARKLVGPLSGLRLPKVGDTVHQGEPAWTLFAEGKGVDMVSPVDGVVVAVNPAAAESPQSVADDPYGSGWLLEVAPSQLPADMRQLLSGELARQYVESVARSLHGHLSPELGLVLQDGGQPVHGLAAELDPDHWDTLARQYLRS